MSEKYNRISHQVGLGDFALLTSFVRIARASNHLSMLAVLVSLVLYLLTSTVALIAQSKAKTVQDSSATVLHLHQQLSRTAQRVVDSTVHLERSFVNSLSLTTTVHAARANKDLESLTDSLVLSARDSLDSSRRDSLRLTARSLQQVIATVETQARKLFGDLFADFTRQLEGSRIVDSLYDGCQSAEDFNSALSDFRDVVDSLRGNFHDSAMSLGEDQFETIRDTLDSFRDSLTQARDNFIDCRLDEIEFQRYRASQLVLSTGYSSHSSYRGRDNGTPQQVLVATIGYRHVSGLSLSASTFWYDNSPKKLEDFVFTAGYRLNVSNIVAVSASYSHFWFSDSDNTSKSVFTDEVDAGLSIDWPVLSLGTDAILDIGSSNEFTLVTSVSHAFDIPLSLYTRISIGPTVTATVGQQSGALTILRTKRVKGKKVTGTQPKVNNSFGILDYEASVPVTIELKHVSFVSAITYVIPLNVVNESTARGFLHVDFTISVSFR